MYRQDANNWWNIPILWRNNSQNLAITQIRKFFELALVYEPTTLQYISDCVFLYLFFCALVFDAKFVRVDLNMNQKIWMASSQTTWTTAPWTSFQIFFVSYLCRWRSSTSIDRWSWPFTITWSQEFRDSRSLMTNITHGQFTYRSLIPI